MRKLLLSIAALAFIAFASFQASAWMSVGMVGGGVPAAAHVPLHVVDVEENDLTDFDAMVADDLTVSASAAANGTNYGIVATDADVLSYGRINLTPSDYTSTGKFYLSFYPHSNDYTNNGSTATMFLRVTTTDLGGSSFIRGEWYINNTQIRFYAHNDAGALAAYLHTFTDGHKYEFFVTRATAVDSSNGSIVLKANGSTVNTWSSVDNYNLFEYLEYLRIGFVIDPDNADTGSFYVDEIIVDNTW